MGGVQARHGNAVVARAAVLAREGNERAQKIAAFNAAKGKDWGLAAEILNGFNDEDIQRLLGGLSKQRLRELDAGAMRHIPPSRAACTARSWPSSASSRARSSGG